MKNYSFHLPTALYFGKGCVVAQAEVFQQFGRKALLVTGRTGAKQAGALAEATTALASSQIDVQLFDEIEANPSIETCLRGATVATSCGADMVIGIGGGSAIDAAKVIAAIVGNGWTTPAHVLSPLTHAALPIIAIPTTAGTGSEANAIAVVTTEDGNYKRSLKHETLFPRASMLDASFLPSLPRAMTISCALDALCHAVESYLLNNTTPISEMLALRAATLLFPSLRNLEAGASPNWEQLSMGACLAGMAIQTTGTALPHPMGYNLTLQCGIPHGSATAYFLPYFIERCTAENPSKVEQLSATLQILPNEIAILLRQLTSQTIDMSQEEAALFASRIAGASQFQNASFPFGEADASNLYMQLFG